VNKDVYKSTKKNQNYGVWTYRIVNTINRRNWWSYEVTKLGGLLSEPPAVF